jgi:hypothetical protein
MREVNRLSLLFIDSYVPVLTPRLEISENMFRWFSLYGFGVDRRENTASKKSSTVERLVKRAVA